MAESETRQWRINEQTPNTIITPHGRISVGWSGNVNELDKLAEDTAALIVRAVNSHADLLAALENTLSLLKLFTTETDDVAMSARREAEAAIAAAKGGAA